MCNDKWRKLSFVIVLFTLMGCGGSENQTAEVVKVEEVAYSPKSVITNSAIDLLPDYNNISITWDDLADNEKGFTVERRPTEQSTFTELINLPANTESYIDSKARVDKSYCYRIGVYNDYGLAYSEESCTDNS
jgi:hypothetical protein